MGYLFYVNMQKRSDEKVYADVHKTDERIYFSPEEAQAAIDADPQLAPYRHVVPLVALTQQEYEALVREVESAVLAERQRCADIAANWDVSHPNTNYGQCIANLILGQNSQSSNP